MASEDLNRDAPDVSTLKGEEVDEETDTGNSKTPEVHRSGPKQYTFNSYEWFDKTRDGRWKCKHCDANYTLNCSSGTKKRHIENFHGNLADRPFVDPGIPSTQRYVHTEANEAALEHFIDTGVRNERDAKIYQCKYCAKSFVKHYFRFREHLSDSCPKMPSDKREDFIAKNQQRMGRQARAASLRPPSSRPGPKRPYFLGKDTDSEEDFDNMNFDDGSDEKLRAVNILTKLLSGATGGGGGSVCKKPLSDYTESDFERESKELKIKIDRLKCKELEEKTRFYSSFSSGFSVIVQACRSYLDEKKQDSSGAGMPSSLDPSSILQAAFEESINGDAHQ